MPKRFCITYAPPQVERTQSALQALVGLEFETDPEAIEAIRNQYPYLPPIASWFIAVPAQMILKELWELKRFEAHQYWSLFALAFPLFYIPVWCCEEITNERSSA